MTLSDQNAARPWARAVLWLCFLGPFFFLSYGFATWYTSQLSYVDSVYFEWEKHIPIIPWSIIPYWSIDLFYGISLFICTTKQELDSHAKRLLSAQIIAVTCFLLFPLTFSFERPQISGMAGAMFDTLYAFDKPFNQAPSLHIALLVILWVIYLRHVPRAFHWLCHLIALSIFLSVLTTYQHHFIDLPTGLLLGWFCVWLWPDNTASPTTLISISPDQRPRRLGALYLLGAGLLGALALLIGGTALWLFWPSWSMLLVASFYLLLGSGGFQKTANGKLSPAARWLLYPYLLAARVNALLWTRGTEPANPIIDNVWLGRFPSKAQLQKGGYARVVDLSAECHAPSTQCAWYALPCLDLVTPDPSTLVQGADLIEQSDKTTPTLVCCALGYSRSTLCVICWLLISQRAHSIEQAAALIKQARPQIVLKSADYTAIEIAWQIHKNKNP